MESNLLRLLRRLTDVERTVLIVGGLLIVGMLGAVTLDRALDRQAPPVVITLAPPAAALDSPLSAAPGALR